MKIGDSVYIIRKYSNEKVECILLDIAENRKVVRVHWVKARGITYELDLVKNLVLCSGSQRERSEIKRWFSVYEPHRISLLKLFEPKEKSKRKEQYNYKQFADDKVVEFNGSRRRNGSDS